MATICVLSIAITLLSIHAQLGFSASLLTDDDDVELRLDQLHIELGSPRRISSPMFGPTSSSAFTTLGRHSRVSSSGHFETPPSMPESRPPSRNGEPAGDSTHSLSSASTFTLPAPSSIAPPFTSIQTPSSSLASTPPTQRKFHIYFICFLLSYKSRTCFIIAKARTIIGFASQRPLVRRTQHDGDMQSPRAQPVLDKSTSRRHPEARRPNLYAPPSLPGQPNFYRQMLQATGVGKMLDTKLQPPKLQPPDKDDSTDDERDAQKSPH